MKVAALYSLKVSITSPSPGGVPVVHISAQDWNVRNCCQTFAIFHISNFADSSISEHLPKITNCTYTRILHFLQFCYACLCSFYI
jgi:hypothetical protein